MNQMLINVSTRKLERSVRFPETRFALFNIKQDIAIAR
jgi:hypothetical protein